jgi:hypothetical protein
MCTGIMMVSPANPDEASNVCKLIEVNKPKNSGAVDHAERLGSVRCGWKLRSRPDGRAR